MKLSIIKGSLCSFMRSFFAKCLLKNLVVHLFFYAVLVLASDIFSNYITDCAFEIKDTTHVRWGQFRRHTCHDYYTWAEKVEPHARDGR